MTSAARGIYGIEHVRAECNGVDDVFRGAHSHEIARFVLRQFLAAYGHHGIALGPWLADPKAADRVTRKVEPRERAALQTAQRLEYRTLGDRERELILTPDGAARALGPAERALSRRSGLRFLDPRRGALIQHHGDIAAQGFLQRHHRLGRERVARTIEVRGKMVAIIV